MAVVLMNAEKAKVLRLNLLYAKQHNRDTIECLGQTLTVEYAEAVLSHYNKVST